MELNSKELRLCFSAAFKAVRIYRGFSTPEVAKILKVNRSYIYSLENGLFTYNRARQEFVKRYCQLLNITDIELDSIHNVMLKAIHRSSLPPRSLPRTGILNRKNLYKAAAKSLRLISDYPRFHDAKKEMELFPITFKHLENGEIKNVKALTKYCNALGMRSLDFVNIVHELIQLK